MVSVWNEKTHDAMSYRERLRELVEQLETTQEKGAFLQGAMYAAQIACNVPRVRAERDDIKEMYLDGGEVGVELGLWKIRYREEKTA